MLLAIEAIGHERWPLIFRPLRGSCEVPVLLWRYPCHVLVFPPPVLEPGPKYNEKLHLRGCFEACSQEAPWSSGRRYK